MSDTEAVTPPAQPSNAAEAPSSPQINLTAGVALPSEAPATPPSIINVSPYPSVTVPTAAPTVDLSKLPEHLAVDVAALQARIEARRAAGTLTPEIEGAINDYIAQIEANLHDGPVGLGEQMKQPEPAQGIVVTELRLAHRDRAIQQLQICAAWLTTQLATFDPAVHQQSVAWGRSMVAFCIDRLKYEAARISRLN